MLKDHFHIEAIGLSGNMSIMTRATQRLRECCDDLSMDDLHVTKLEGIAKARFGLSVAADLMHKVYIRKELLPHGETMRSLVAAAKTVCLQENLHWLG